MSLAILQRRLPTPKAAPRATRTSLSCSPNFPYAQYLDIHTLTHELIVKKRDFKFKSHADCFNDELALERKKQ